MFSNRTKGFVVAFSCLFLFFPGAASALDLSTGSVNMQTGEAATVQILNGSGFYSISSSDKRVASASCSGDVLTVTGNAYGSAEITVNDGTGQAKLDVDVSMMGVSTNKLFLKQGETTTLQIKGGVPPFSFTKSPVLMTDISGQSLTVTALVSGTAEIIVTDSISNRATIDVVVSGSLKPARSTLYMAPSQSESVKVDNGSAPYTAVSDDPSVATASMMDTDKLKVDSVSVGKTYVTITDSSATSNAAAVRVDVKPLNLTFQNVNIMEGKSKSIDIKGVGFYNVRVRDPSVAKASLAGSTVTLDGAAVGNTTLTVSDINGNTIDAKISVYEALSVSPSKVVVAEGNSTGLRITGGVNPYYVTSNDTRVVPSPGTVMDASFTVNASSKGSAVLSVADLDGNTAQAGITVVNNDVVLPYQKIDIRPGETAKVNMAGGTGLYSVYSDKNSVATADLASGEIVIKGISPGTATIVIEDSGTGRTRLDVSVMFTKPSLSYFTDKGKVSLSWTSVPQADSYTLYYAPADSTGLPDIGSLQTLDVSNITKIDFVPPPNLTFFAAIKAFGKNLSSDFSNIVKIDTQ